MKLSKKRKQRKSVETQYSFFCYRMPVSAKVGITITSWPDVQKEGGKKKWCRTCVKSVVDSVREGLVAELKKMGMSCD